MSIVFSRPRLQMSINGEALQLTQGLVIDHVTRRVRGSVVIVPGDTLIESLRALRGGQMVQVKLTSFLDCGMSGEVVEYEGPAEPLMIRVRGSRGRLSAISFVFKLAA